MPTRIDRPSFLIGSAGQSRANPECVTRPEGPEANGIFRVVSPNIAPCGRSTSQRGSMPMAKSVAGHDPSRSEFGSSADAGRPNGPEGHFGNLRSDRRAADGPEGHSNN
jgi:hypothetical protein